jgi:RNA polymerase sigma-70 factor (ECF subfamily)
VTKATDLIDLSDTMEPDGNRRAGDSLPSSTLEELFALSSARLVRSLTVYAGSRQAAEEAVQEAFVQAYLRWDRVRAYDNPEAWIRRVAINRLSNTRRSRRRGRAAVSRLDVDGMAPAPGEPFEPEIARAIRALSDKQRLAVALYYLEDLSIAEVARAMNVSGGAVAQHLDRARASLRQTLRSQDER